MWVVKLQAARWLTRAEVKILGGLAHLKTLWRIWNLRSLILVSLGLQVILILFAPFRKKTSNAMVAITIWLAYLLADYIAIQAVSLIPNYSSTSTTTQPDLLSFWAPFLLVHLGGPDPITALSLEDNELWLRTALHFFTYISATGRVFFQSLPTNLLSIPTILMFCAGFLKYLERVLSLYNARLSQFKSSLLTDQDSDPNQLVEQKYYSEKPHYHDLDDDGEMSVMTNIQLLLIKEKVNEVQEEEEEEEEGEEEEDNNVVQERIKCFPFLSLELQRSKVILVWDAYSFFEKYKCVYVDLTLSLHDRDKSRAYFLQPTLTPDDAFTVLEIELNFTYEVFFTKMIVIHQSFGTWIRRVSFGLQLSSLVIWILFIDKKRFHMFDIWITYTLLVGAVLIDSIAFLMVFLSDWQVAMLSRRSKLRVSLYDKLLWARDRTWGGFWETKEASWRAILKRLFCRRWSESVPQFNLIDFCALPCSNFTNSMFKYMPPIKNKFQEFNYVSRKWFANELRDFIFDEIREKAEMAEDLADVDEIYSSKGGLVMRTLGGLDLDPFLFYKWTVDVEYDKCVLIWHVATEILYQTDNELHSTPEAEESMYPKLCKILSDYMMYLFKWQPEMITAVAGTSEVRIQDTSKDATLFLEKVISKAKKGEMNKDRVRNLCKTLMDADVDMIHMKGGRRSKSVLFEAVRLAKELRNLKERKTKEMKETETVEMWEVMAKVWVELLCYSASHTRANAHAAQLKQGGELLTLVWLLMLHLGLTKNFHTTQDN